MHVVEREHPKLRTILILISAATLAIMLATACNRDRSIPLPDQPPITRSDIPTSVSIATATATEIPTSTPTLPTPTLVPTSTPSPPTPAEIFAEVSPAIAYIETTSSSGTALLIDGGYLITNSHIVWPNAGAQVSFPDGTVIRNAPLVGWDLLADLAVLGPVDVSAQPLTLSESAAPSIGSEVLTIGYPGSPGDLPQPTLGRGLVSRFREWQETGLLYIQSDATIEGGHSGGALISETGEIIGLIGYSAGESNHSLALTASDVAPRIRSMISGGDPSGIGSRLLSDTGGAIRHSGTLGTFWDTNAYVIQEPVGTQVNITLESRDDLAWAVYDSSGNETLYIDDEYSGIEAGTLIIEYAEPYFVVVTQFGEDTSRFTINATHTLIPIPDPDDGRTLRIGQQVQGSLDYPGDIDTFTIHLSFAQRVQMSTTSFALDTFLAADFYGAINNEIIIDDDGGGGLFGLDSQLVYRAPHTGEFIVVVSENYFETGGYTLAISRAAPSLQLTSTTRESLFDDPGYDSETTVGFGPHELREAFSSLPATFEELDPATSGLSAADLGLEDLFDHSVSYGSADPFQLLVVLNGHLNEDDRLGFDILASSTDIILSALISSPEFSRDEVRNYGTLAVESIGDTAGGFWFDLISDGMTFRADMIFLRRGDIGGLVYSVSFPDVTVLASSQEVAQLLDAAFVEYLAEQ